MTTKQAGKRGGKARWRKCTKKQIKKEMRRIARIRWGKRR